MQFHLPSLPTVLLSTERNQDRQSRRRVFFAEHGYSNVRWIMGRSTTNHHRGAHEMAIQTLSEMRCPCFWLEDDAEACPAYRDSITIPDEAQLAYLGGHRGGSSKYVLCQWEREHVRFSYNVCPWINVVTREWRKNHRGLYADTADSSWVRVLSMYGGHAILWLDDEVRVKMLDHIQHAPAHWPYDWLLARNQWRYQIYGLREPWFYQMDGNNDAKTRGYCLEV